MKQVIPAPQYRSRPTHVRTEGGYLVEAFLFEGAKRYNIKGNKYFESIKKYYSVDVGLRNAKLNFRQQEITHIMENVIYNELRMRGFAVDVGVVEAREMRNGKSEYIQYEIDFIASNGRDKYFIQSAFSLDSEEKRQQELKVAPQSRRQFPEDCHHRQRHCRIYR